jgi:hypothetical protein
MAAPISRTRKGEQVSAIKAALRAGRAIGRAGAHFQKIDREKWKQLMNEELERSWAREESRLACLGVLRHLPDMPPSALALIERELAEENPGATLIATLRELRERNAERLAALTRLRQANKYAVTGPQELLDALDQADAAIERGE